jgi:hypothetical protein
MEHALGNSRMRQVSARNYSELLQELASTYGMEKSTVSEHFIASSR